MTNPDSETKDRKQRKEEGKLKKRQRIEESGGIRPRGANNDEKTKKSRSSVDDDVKNAVTSPEKYSKDETKQSTATATATAKNNEDDDSSRPQQRQRPPQQRERPLFGNYDNPNASATNRPGGSMNNNNNRNSSGKPSYISRHRFGRVMETVPCRNKSRFSTVSIALPGSVLSNCQTRELRTLLVGQIARACTIYHVDEIIVFDDKLGKTGNSSGSGGGWRDFKRQKNRQDGGNNNEKQEIPTEKKVDDAKIDADRNNNNEQPQFERRVRSTHQEFMARLLQYCECPQYLRRQFFPMHPDLQFAGLLAPVDAPHHVREGDRSKYREGVVMNKNSSNGNSLVNCGIRNRPVE
ncbi:MAG: putative SPOUT superfamily RNA methylase MTH1 [Bacillariaceae sp.]|jgi:predicted SPOUT superfamily RNA methylase MTH1